MLFSVNLPYNLHTHRTASIVDLVNGPMKKDITVTKKPDEDKILHLEMFAAAGPVRREIIKYARLHLKQHCIY